MKVKSFFYSALLLSAFFGSLNVHAQLTPPAAYSGTTPVNYVRTWDVLAPDQSTSNILTRPLKEVRLATQYVDGLGRPMETVAKQGSFPTGGTASDLVNANTYDAYSRETTKYLSSAANNTGGNTSLDDGLFKLNPFQQQATFMSQQYSSQGETYFYGYTLLEASPLNRPVKTYAPGNSWVGTAGSETAPNLCVNWTDPVSGLTVGKCIINDHSVKSLDLLNTASDDVKIWKVQDGVNLKMTIVNNGNGTQTVSWVWDILPPNSGSLLYLYRPAGSTGAWSTAYQGNPGEWANHTIPTGNYEYALQLIYTGQMIYAYNPDPGTFTAAASYAAGKLYKKATLDEHGNETIEFKDGEGKTILRKAQLSATADLGGGSGYTGWLCTYYIYDDHNQLRCVIQPEGVKALSTGSWTFTPTILNEQCFRYEYDERGRMITKKIPGAGETWMVYDALDRLVLSQDANMRAQSKWMYTLYDALNRPEVTGIWTNSQNRVYHKGLADVSTSYPNLGGQTIEELTRTFYDDYSWRSSWGSPLDASFNTTYNTYLQTESNATWPFPQKPIINSTATRGLVTGMRVKVLGGSTYLFSEKFYDDKGRVIQIESQNNLGSINILTTQYTWAGQTLVTVSKTEKPSPTAQTNIIVTQMTYDDLGRMVKLEKKASNSLVNAGVMPSSFNTIAQYEYDALGQSKKKKLAPAYNSNAGLETENYEYNIRGWTLGMNRDYAKDANNTNYFGYDLGYDKGNNSIIGNQTYSNPQFSGNIEGVVWKSKGDGEKRKYDFTYDAASRLITADFNQYTGSTFNKTANVDFSVSNLGFDANGNILTMNQKGLTLGASPVIDQLTYTYQTGSNKLAKVTDALSDPNTKLGDFKDGTNGATDDYAYDANGSVTLDNNKAISNIIYNHLNLPSVITVTGKGTITYTYDATGTKLAKTVNETGMTVTYMNTPYTSDVTTTTRYLGDAVYESKLYSNSNVSALNYTDRLQFLGQEEGRIRFKAEDNTLQYDYMIKDHLGNVRMVLTEEQKTDYYPAATLEGSISTDGSPNAVFKEKDYYTIDPARIATAPGGMGTYQNNTGILNPNPNSVTAATSQKAYVLNSNTNKMGLGIVLKVMSGDVIDIWGRSYWATNAAGGSAPSVSDFLNGLMAAPGGSTAPGHTTAVQLGGVAAVTGPITTFLTTGHDAGPGKPHAYINYVFLDEQFQVRGSGVSAVDAGGLKTESQHHADLQGLVAPRNGYIYVYCSNESPVDVYFDNLQVVHKRSPMLEETHYYPFGLTMSGISSTALLFGNSVNKKKFNGVELANKDFFDGSGLELYEMKFRMYDPQIGRFNQTDPSSDLSLNYSPYAFAQNNPILFCDPYGLDTIRGGFPRNYKPQPRDVFINDKGKTAIYDPESGWTEEKNLKGVSIQASSGGNNCSKDVTIASFFVGLFDFGYSMWESNYDHSNYTTTKGQLRPLPTGKNISRQAKIYQTRSSAIKKIGFGLSFLSNLLTAIQVRNQYLEGGIHNVDPVDATSLTLGTTGLTANVLSFFGYGGSTVTAISEFTGVGGIAIQSYQLWMMTFQTIYNTNLPNNPVYSGSEAEQFQAAMDDQASGGNGWY